MKNVAMLFVAALALAFATTAGAGEHQAPAQASISADMLAQMGMGGMRQLSDEQGMQVRGTGKVVGEIRYGQIEIECGGQISGSVETVDGLH